MWKIKHIYEADYGCEERLPGDKLKCLVELEDENGLRKSIEVEDEWLRLNNLNEGSEIDIQ
ncbi:MAG: hypothetical protein ACI4EU_00065 [Butyrivibrio sp.]